MSIDRLGLRHPDRHQHVMEVFCLDKQLVPEHRARHVWRFVEGHDVSELEARNKSRLGHPGAPAISPRLLLALWLYVTLDGGGPATAWRMIYTFEWTSALSASAP